jgi:hypothetical protein
MKMRHFLSFIEVGAFVLASCPALAQAPPAEPCPPEQKECSVIKSPMKPGSPNTGTIPAARDQELKAATGISPADIQSKGLSGGPNSEIRKILKNFNPF